MPKIFVVLPVYNEEKNLERILPRIARHSDAVICVNDGSRDGSLDILKKFARRRGVFLLDLPVNRGMAGALKAGFQFVLYLQSRDLVKGEDLVVTIDADGQHKPEYIPRLVKYLGAQGADVVLTRRDFSVYPTYKIWGNRFLTWTNSLLSGMRYRDVESGLRLLKVRTLSPILRYYTGVKYSCAQEIAFISAREGFKIDNDFEVEIAYYRPGTTVWDGFIVLALSLFVFTRWILRLSLTPTLDLPLMESSLKKSRALWLKGKGSPKNGT